MGGVGCLNKLNILSTWHVLGTCKVKCRSWRGVNSTQSPGRPPPPCCQQFWKHFVRQTLKTHPFGADTFSWHPLSRIVSLGRRSLSETSGSTHETCSLLNRVATGWVKVKEMFFSGKGKIQGIVYLKFLLEVREKSGNFIIRLVQTLSLIYVFNVMSHFIQK